MKLSTMSLVGALAIGLAASMPIGANAQGRDGGRGGSPPTASGGTVGGGGARMSAPAARTTIAPRGGNTERFTARSGGDRITGTRTDRRVVTRDRPNRTVQLGDRDRDGRRWRGRDGRWRIYRPGIGVTFYDSSYYDGDYDTAYYYDRGDWTEDALDRCEETFRSFDRRTGTYVTYEGERRLCPYLR